MSSRAVLTVRGLHAAIEGKEILKGVDVEVPQGEIHALMGPNGSGKSTLAYTLMGHPKYAVTSGSASFDGQDLLAMPPDERARLGLFLSFQYPTAIPGVTTVNFLRAALRAQGRELPARQFLGTLKSEMQELRLDETFGRRYINDGFSGGEKKRAEILQMAMFRPRMAILDETDSGLDVDALRTVATAVLRLSGRGGAAANGGPVTSASANGAGAHATGAANGGAATSDGGDPRAPMGILVITHYPRILEFLEPDRVHVMSAGRIVTSGGHDLAREIEAGGYDPILGPGADPDGAGGTPSGITANGRGGSLSGGAETENAAGQRSSGAETENAAGQRSSGAETENAAGQRSSGAETENAAGSLSGGADATQLAGGMLGGEQP